MDSHRTDTVLATVADRYRTAGPSCSRCNKTLGDLRDRLFGIGGALMCERCYQDERFEALEHARRGRRRRARYATFLSFGSLAGLILLLVWTKSAAVASWGVGLVAIAHVVAEVLSPRDGRTSWPI